MQQKLPKEYVTARQDGEKEEEGTHNLMFLVEHCLATKPPAVATTLATIATSFFFFFSVHS